MKHLPNIITLLRIPLSVLFFVLFATGTDSGAQTWVSLVFLVLAGLTDAVDGYLSRRLDAESEFGRIIDPLLDKVLICGGFIVLLGAKEISYLAGWMVIVIVCRELLVTVLRSQIEKSGQPFGALKSGKAKMVLQWLALVLVVAFESIARGGQPELSRTAPTIAVWLATIATAWSAVPYVIRARPMLEKSWSTRG